MNLLSRLAVSSLLAAVSLGSAARGQHTEAGSAISAKVLLDTATTNSGGPIDMPDGRLKAHAIKLHIPPGAVLPAHKHPYPRYGYMLSGRISVTNLATGGVREFNTGDVIVEDVDVWHEARNAQTSPVELLVIDFTPVGVGENVIRKAPDH
ncbi:MAG: cupin domain-containing protein [Caulobacter sp.]